MMDVERRIFSLPLSWRGRMAGIAWLALAALSAGMAAHAILGPRQPAGAADASEPGKALAVTPGLQKEIAALGAQSQDFARQQQQTRARIAALEEQLAAITGSLPATARAATDAPTIISTEFGVELASATDIGEIDAVWQAMRQIYDSDLAALTPAIRIAGNSEGPELVLVAGPLANARDAARVCATLRAGGQGCREVPYAGEMIRLGAAAPAGK